MRIYQNCLLDFGQRGSVAVNVRRNAVNVTMRRSRYGQLQVTAPYGVDSGYLQRVLPEMIDRLVAKEKPHAGLTDYFFGWKYEFPEGDIRIVEQTDAPGRLRPRWNGRTLLLEVHGNQLADPVFISDCIRRYSGQLARQFVIQCAQKISARVGISPSRWEIGRGTRTLGTCHPSDRHISLSGLLLLLPDELREYVICHELAHLTHADHSPAFHRLCDAYLSGRERALHRALKSFPWPVIR